MKLLEFNELQEDKKYVIGEVKRSSYLIQNDEAELFYHMEDGTLFKKKKGVLCEINHDNRILPSHLRMCQVIYIRFIEKIDKVDYKTAFDAMLQGKECSFHNKIFYIKDKCLRIKNYENAIATVPTYLLTDKEWVIRD